MKILGLISFSKILSILSFVLIVCLLVVMGVAFWVTAQKDLSKWFKSKSEK